DRVVHAERARAGGGRHDRRPRGAARERDGAARRHPQLAVVAEPRVARHGPVEPGPAEPGDGVQDVSVETQKPTRDSRVWSRAQAICDARTQIVAACSASSTTASSPDANAAWRRFPPPRHPGAQAPPPAAEPTA